MLYALAITVIFVGGNHEGKTVAVYYTDVRSEHATLEECVSTGEADGPRIQALYEAPVVWHCLEVPDVVGMGRE